MSKILVQVPSGVGLQVEVPEFKLDTKGRPAMEGEGKNRKPIPFGERSCEGALHLRPNSTKVMTEAELEHVRKVHPDVGRRLVVIKKLPDTKTASASAAKAAVPAAPPPPAPAAADGDGDGDKKKGKK